MVRFNPLPDEAMESIDMCTGRRDIPENNVENGVTPYNQSIKLKAFADENFSVVQINVTYFKRTENIVGKEKNAGHQYFFLFFHDVFKKFSHPEASKVVIAW